MPRRSTPQRLTDAQRRLVEENLRLVGYTLNKYYPISIPEGETEDFNSIGCIGLCRAAAHYNPEEGPFAPYAIQSIRREIRREFVDRYRAKRKHEALLTLDALTEDDKALEEAIPDGQVSVELLASLHIAMDTLPPTERDILQRRMDGERHREIAADMGYTRQAVEWHLNRARRILREQIAV